MIQFELFRKFFIEQIWPNSTISYQEESAEGWESVGVGHHR